MKGLEYHVKEPRLSLSPSFFFSFLVDDADGLL